MTDTRQNIASQARDGKGRLLPKVTDTPSKIILDALNTCFKALREHHPEIPNAVIVLGTSSTTRYGQYQAGTWEGAKQTKMPEIILFGEALKRGAQATLATLIHESAHALATTRKIQDTSRQGRFHNKRFKALAEEVGIDVSHNSSIGWSITALPAETATLYKFELQELAKALKTYRIPPEETEPKEKTTMKIACDCKDAKGKLERPVTVPIKWFDKGDIICDVCDQAFMEVV